MMETLTATSCKIKVLRMGPHSTRQDKPTSPSSMEVNVGGSSGSLPSLPDASAQEQIDGLRLEFQEQIHGLRLEVQEQIHGLRIEVHAQVEDLRHEVQAQVEDLRQEFHVFKTEVRRDIASLHSKLDKIVGKL